MCVVSFISDEWTRKPPHWFPELEIWPPQPYVIPSIENQLREEFERLKKELQEARKQDIRDNNPDCHMEDKVTIIKSLAKILGVDMGDVFEGHK